MTLSKESLEKFTNTYIVPVLMDNIFGNFQSFWDPSIDIKDYTIDQQIMVDFLQQFGSVSLSKKWWHKEEQYSVVLGPPLLTNKKSTDTATWSWPLDKITLYIHKTEVEVTDPTSGDIKVIDMRDPNSLEILKVEIVQLINKTEARK